MRKSLRPYQEETLTALRTRLRESVHPLLVNASVGAGKSLIIAELLLVIERAGWRALCLTMNAELIRQNAEAYQYQGGSPGIFCAALSSKNYTHPVIFASPHSIAKAIKNKHAIQDAPFNLIIIDEAHNISPHDNETMYMRILNHYGMCAQFHNRKFRIVGLTGTPFRGKGLSIVGDNQLFKEQVCDISTSWLIENGYLVTPEFGSHNESNIDYSTLRVKSNGQFNSKELSRVVDENERLTGKIMREVLSLTENRRGTFIFASTKKHCDECLRSLPQELSAIITGNTSQQERIRILDLARVGKIRYLININVLTVGVDVPIFDTVVFVRPTESLVLYTQAIGRGLRLHADKTTCQILDYAGNLERHGDIDNPIINEALQPKENDDPDYCIPCLDCSTNNKVTARRCVGVHDNKRCDHYFEWKECPGCAIENDITSRACRSCGIELIDPNKKLKKHSGKQARTTFDLIEGKYWVLLNYSGTAVFHAKYTTSEGLFIYESFMTHNALCCNIFYGKFIKQHVNDASKHYPHLSSQHHLKTLIEYGEIQTPFSLECVFKNNRYCIVKRIFSKELE